MHLIINPSDIFYLTGVRSHDPAEVCILYSTSEKNTVLCDARMSTLFDSEKYIICSNREEWKNVFQKYSEIETDPDFLTQSFREKLESYGIKISMKKSPIQSQRVIKNSAEIETIRISQSLNKKVYDAILPFLIPGVTEVEIARKIQILQLEFGASGPSFPPIVAFGENSAVPHHSPMERKLQAEDIILLDMGLIFCGYCSDMTRMVYQRGVSDEAQKIGELVTHATSEVIQWAKIGMKMSELDKKARELLGEYEPYFTHSLGHGVGVDIHESPYVSHKSDEILQPGMIITIEPGIYIIGKYGARYEEMCIVESVGLSVL